MNTDLIRKGYNRIAPQYARKRETLRSGKYLTKFLQLLPAQSLVLDIGCGDGVPVDSTLIKHDHLVIGIDTSSEQIALAKRNCPTGDFQIMDMQTLAPHQYSVDAVVSFYAIFHIPRENHLELLKTINTFLPIEGYLLITLGDQDFEGFHELLGTQMWSSHYGAKQNAELVEAAGFEILLNELDRSGGERHQYILAQKKLNLS